MEMPHVRNQLDEIEEALDVHVKVDLDAFVAQCNRLSDCMSTTVVGITQTYD